MFNFHATNMTMIYLHEKILKEGKANYDYSEAHIPVCNSF